MIEDNVGEEHVSRTWIVKWRDFLSASDVSTLTDCLQIASTHPPYQARYTKPLNSD